MADFYQVINPLCEEHVYTINLDHDISNDLVVKTYNFLKERITPKRTLEFIKSCHDPIIFKLLIDLMDYSDWIKLSNYVPVLKYYWSKTLINKIIDTNKFKIYQQILNELPIDKQLVDLSNQYDAYYNFTKEIFSKRITNVQNILLTIDKSLNINNLYGGYNTILYLGENRNHINKYNDAIYQLTFYPKDIFVLHLIKNQLFFQNEDSLSIQTIYNEQLFIIKFYKKCYGNGPNYIVINEQGYVDLINFKIMVTAELYQQLGKLNNNSNNPNNPNNLNNWIKVDEPLYFRMVITQKIELKINLEKCYDCRKFHRSLGLLNYSYYCTDCAVKNYIHKIEMANLSNFCIFMTGIRIKIGFMTALKVLRCGGTLIGTTRYPNFALYNYSKEKDYNVWKDRLIIIECDFTKIDSVYKMLNLLDQFKINAIINNAFRTIRPSQFYNKAVKQIDKECENLMISLKNDLTVSIFSSKSIMIKPTNINVNQLVTYNPNIELTNFRDVKDILHDNSWTKKLEEIDPKEIVECVAINQLIPTLLINSLKGKLIGPKFIINVSSLEGQFNTSKSDKHIHTNMCKAALNMLIRSLNEDSDPNLHVYSIDPGYVSGVNHQHDDYPVTIEDAASKILYPIIQFFNGNPLDKKIVKLRCYESENW
jgi:NAD(P)-dependent dehydrogenase (short-subunit alcohol dehydrogenase family)